jgi:hypothetical protein
MSGRLKPNEQFARLLEIHSPIAAGSDPAMAAMSNIANALRAVGQAPGMPTPDPVFRAALRQRLVAVATVQDATAADTRTRASAVAGVRSRAQRRIAAFAGTVMMGTSVAGVGVAAARSLPGDPFYGVKRATESVQLWATRGDEAKGRRHLEFARTRLAEAKAMSPEDSHLVSTLAAMDAQTKAASTELITAYRTSHSTQPLADLVTFSSQQLADLNKLASKLPNAVKSKERGSVTLLTGVVHRVHKVANGVCILCGTRGHNNGPGPAVTPTKSPSPNDSPSARPHRSGHPGSTATTTRPGGGSTTAKPTKSESPTPTKSSGAPLPKPSDIISSLLHPKHTKTPIPIVTKLLGLLGNK